MLNTHLDHVYIIALLLALICLFPVTLLFAQGWHSALVQSDETGKLIYSSDEEGNRIPDFSYAGYRNSEEYLPVIETVSSISPAAGHYQIEWDASGRSGIASGIYYYYLNAGEYQKAKKIVLIK